MNGRALAVADVQNIGGHFYPGGRILDRYGTPAGCAVVGGNFDFTCALGNAGQLSVCVYGCNFRIQTFVGKTVADAFCIDGRIQRKILTDAEYDGFGNAHGARRGLDLNGCVGEFSVERNAAHIHRALLERGDFAVCVDGGQRFIADFPGDSAGRAAGQGIAQLHRLAHAHFAVWKRYVDLRRRFYDVNAHGGGKSIVGFYRNIGIAAPRAVEIAVLIDADVFGFAGCIRKPFIGAVRVHIQLPRFPIADVQHGGACEFDRRGDDLDQPGFALRAFAFALLRDDVGRSRAHGGHDAAFVYGRDGLVPACPGGIVERFGS